MDDPLYCLAFFIMSYSEKLKDPRWQKRRLEILSQDGFKCQWCGDTKSTLHVHHFVYKGEPWEAEDGDLSTICEKCHWLQHFKDKLNPIERRLFELIFEGTGLFIDYSKYSKKELVEFIQLKDRQLINKRNMVYKLLNK